jgi:hypothetical protein
MVEFGCRCGAIRGHVRETSPRTVNRVICYCDDCQAFAHHLGRADLLDPHGGTDIVQFPPASLAFQEGQERIVGVRLTPKGLYRWYARCCHTPLGNMVGPLIPFVGVVTEAFQARGQAPDEVFGRPLRAIMGEFAVGEPTSGSRGIGAALLVRSLAKVIGWRLTGRAWPHPFFDRSTRKPIYPVTALSPDQREALRPLCGPRPTAPRESGTL